MNQKLFVNLDCALALLGKGFDWPCDYMYANQTRVSDEIYQKHPGLSDDDYLDLTDEYGGPYKHDEVYKTYLEPYKCYCENTPQYLQTDYLKMVCAMPTLAQARTWLRTVHHIDVVVFPVTGGYKAKVIIPDRTDSACCSRITLTVCQPDDKADDGVTELFDEYEKAEQAAVSLAATKPILS